MGTALLVLQRRAERRIFPQGDWSCSVEVQGVHVRRTIVLACDAVARSEGATGQAWYWLVRRLLLIMCVTQGKCLSLLQAHQAGQPLSDADRQLVGWFVHFRDELGVTRDFAQFVKVTKHLLATAGTDGVTKGGPTDEEALSALSLVRRTTANLGMTFLVAGGDEAGLKLAHRQVRDELEKLGVLDRGLREKSSRRRVEADVEHSGLGEGDEPLPVSEIVHQAQRLVAVRDFLDRRGGSEAQPADRAAAWAWRKAIEKGREPNAAEAARMHELPVAEVRRAVGRLRAGLQAAMRGSE